MASKTNKACTLKVGQIEKNPILSLSTSGKDIEKYARVTKAYGNVTPAIVGQSGDRYIVLAGQARLEACAKGGIREMPAVVTETDGEAEQMKLALLLSTVREEGSPLSEGAFIDALITRHGVTRRELTLLLKKSKSWISKRQSLAMRLSEGVKGMVKDGVVCARAAEEIAKLPADIQFAFADKAARDSLSKTDVGELVSLYMREGTDSVVREEIMESPLAVLDACAGPSAGPRHKERRGLAERIAGNAGFVCRLARELTGLMATADVKSLEMASPHLSSLREALSGLMAALDRAAASVSPGKQGGAS
jgi:ParB/RepB/Spo0J family partition protein